MAYKSTEDRNAYARRWYAANKEVHKARVAKNNKERREFLRQTIQKAKDKPCADCSTRYPLVCMDFDHLPGVEKLFNIGNSVGQNRYSLQTILDEIAKCEVVCANCHRIRTDNRRRGIEEFGRPRSAHNAEIAGSNPAPATKP